MNLIYFLKLFSFSLLSVTFCLFAGCNMFDFSQKSTKSSDADNDSEITVASYNVQCLGYSADKSAIVEEIKTINPDIIGLQELDNATSRSGYVDQLKMLADECGYEYYYFTKTIDFMGGEYGHGVMSKYPITKTESKKFDEHFGEERCFSR